MMILSPILIMIIFGLLTLMQGLKIDWMIKLTLNVVISSLLVILSMLCIRYNADDICAEYGNIAAIIYCFFNIILIGIISGWLIHKLHKVHNDIDKHDKPYGAM